MSWTRDFIELHQRDWDNDFSSVERRYYLCRIDREIADGHLSEIGRYEYREVSEGLKGFVFVTCDNWDEIPTNCEMPLMLCSRKTMEEYVKKDQLPLADELQKRYPNIRQFQQTECGVYNGAFWCEIPIDKYLRHVEERFGFAFQKTMRGFLTYKPFYVPYETDEGPKSSSVEKQMRAFLRKRFRCCDTSFREVV